MYPYLNFFGTPVSSYFLVISLASLLGSLWFIRRSAARGLRQVVAIDLTLVTLVAGFLGARALHVVYEEPLLYRLHPAAVLEFWNGGFVFLGGVASAWIAAVVFCVFRKEAFWFWADIAAPAIALGYAIGRFGCFLNGCCYGGICELPWSIYMHGGFRHPTQLYASLWELALVVVLVLNERRFKVPGRLFNTWLILHAVGRIIMENFREDPRGAALGGLSIGIWMSVTLIGLGLFNLVSGLQLSKTK